MAVYGQGQRRQTGGRAAAFSELRAAAEVSIQQRNQTPTIMNENPVPPPVPQSPNQSQARMWNMWCHLSALAGLIVPFGSVLGPLIIWLIKKNELPSVDVHGKAALNFQLTVAIAALAGGVAAFVLSFFCLGWLLFPLVVVIGLAGLVFAVIAGIKANDGQDYTYPFSLTLIN